MIGHATLRRLGTFTCVFGVSFAVLVALSDEPRGPDLHAPGAGAESGETAGEAGTRPGIGSGGEARLRHDDHVLIGGRRVVYRAWEVRWARSEALPTQDAEERKRRMEECILHFFSRPTETAPSPTARGDEPGTTRISAASGTLSYRQGIRPDATLHGNVRVTQYRDVGEAHLTTEELWCDGEERQAWSDERVHIVDAAFELEGVGLRSDLKLLDLQLEKDVRGAYAGRVGSVGARGPARISCTGRGTLEALDDPQRRGSRAQRRWLATFEDDVVLVQGGDELRCDRLELEFLRGRSRAPGDVPAVDRFVATGNVGLRSLETGRDYSVACDRITGWRETATRRDGTRIPVQFVRFEGERVDVEFEGSLRRDAPASDAATTSDDRMTITCTGGALMKRRPHPDPAAAAGDERITITFEDDVRVVHADPDADRETVLEAPRATLHGTRRSAPETASPTDKPPPLTPETLTAEGGVRIASTEPDRRLDGTAQVGTWLHNPTSGATTFRLAGRPKVVAHGVRTANPFGGGTTRDPRSWSQVSARTDLSIDIYPRPEQGRPPDRPESFVVTGKDDVVVEQYAGETRISRLEGETKGRAVFDHANEMRALSVEGNARFLGWSETPDAHGNRRRGEASGQRITVLREPSDDPLLRTATATVLGTAAKPAVAIVHENRPDGTVPVHEVHGEVIRYSGDGSVIEAARSARARLFAAGGGARSGPVDIRAGKLRAHLAPTVTEKAERQRTPLERVTAEGGVIIEGKDVKVTASQAEYEVATGVAVATGRPARVVWKTQDAAEHPSYVVSPTLRVYLDPSAEGQARLQRASCTGGDVVAYLPERRRDTKKTPRILRVRVSAKGPINLERGRASAGGGVVLRYEEPITGGRWREFVKVRCDDVDLEFDPDPEKGPDGKVTLEKRLQRVRATATGDRRVHVTSAQFDGMADEVIATADDTLVRLYSRGSHRVEVTEKDPARRFLCDEGAWNWVTNEWRDFVRFILLGE